MTEAVFAADPARLLIAAATGIVLLLLLIIKFKIHPVLSLLISALVIGLGAGMPVPTLVNTVEKGAGETLQGIVLLIGLGSLFGGILEVSGGAQCVAQTLINRFGEKKAGTMEDTLRLLSIIRLLQPHVLLPSTTALGTIHPLGREKGIQAGANVVMPNLSPVKNRKQYELYDNKICTGEEAAECRGCMGRRVASVGYELVTERGDAV